MSSLEFLWNTSDLNALTQASSSFSDIYTRHKQKILNSVLLRDLGTNGFERAVTIYKARQLPPLAATGRKESVEAFLGWYTPQSSIPHISQPVSLDTLQALASFHDVIREVTFDFCRSSLSVYSVPKVHTQAWDPLSCTERRRIYRALYRLELLHILFYLPCCSEVPSDEIFDVMDVSLAFLSIFKTWEVEEICCIRDFLVYRYRVLLREGDGDLLRIQPSKYSPLIGMLPLFY